MFKFQIHYRRGERWHQSVCQYETLDEGEYVADQIRIGFSGVQTVVISQIWIPRTER